MLHSAEGLCHLYNVFGGYKSHNGRNCRHIILNIVFPRNTNVPLVHYKGIIPVIGRINIAFFIAKYAVFHLVHVAEEKAFSLNVLFKAACNVVFKIEGGTAVLALVGNNVSLCVDIFLHILVNVKMIGRNIGHNRGKRTFFHGNKLKRGKLDNGIIVLVHSVNLIKQRRADISAEINFLTRRFQ